MIRLCVSMNMVKRNPYRLSYATKRFNLSVDKVTFKNVVDT